MDELNQIDNDRKELVSLIEKKNLAAGKGRRWVHCR
jgi:hypothetical protein